MNFSMTEERLEKLEEIVIMLQLAIDQLEEEPEEVEEDLQEPKEKEQKKNKLKPKHQSQPPNND